MKDNRIEGISFNPMTHAEALNLVDEIVSKAIPLNYDSIQCPAKRAVEIEKAKTRRMNLSDSIRSMIIRLQDSKTNTLGQSVDLLEPLGRFLIAINETDDIEEAVEICNAAINYDGFVFDRIELEIPFKK